MVATKVSVAVYKKPNVGGTYPVGVPQTSDEFAAHSLALNGSGTPTVIARGFFSRSNRMVCDLIPFLATEAVNLWSVPNLAAKLPAPTFTLTTKVDANGLLPNEEAEW
jgi:hypothetical protein